MNEIFLAWTSIAGVADFIHLAFVVVVITSLLTGLFDYIF